MRYRGRFVSGSIFSRSLALPCVHSSWFLNGFRVSLDLLRAPAPDLMQRSIMFQLQDLGVHGIRDIDGPLIRGDHQVMGFADQV